MKSFIRTLVFRAITIYAAPSFGAANLSVVDSIAMLRSIAPAAAATMGHVQVQDYYGTDQGCPIQYHWSASSKAQDNGGSVINSAGHTGDGRWLLSLPSNSPVHSCVFGIKIDNSPIHGGGTDQSKAFQAMLTWAGSPAGPNRVHIDSKQGSCIRIGTTLVPTPGEIIEGDGMGQYAGTTNVGSCIRYTATSGYVFALQTPHPGFGAVPAEAPKFRDFGMYLLDATTSAGGCIQLNSIAGGFSDDKSSQQPLIHPEFKNLVCNLGYNNNNVQIGIQCSKCADGGISNVDVYFGGTGFDIEGSENFVISGGGRITHTFGPMIKLISHGTFGNNNVVRNYQLLWFQNFGQTVDSFILNNARESVIYDNLFENFGLPNSNIRSVIHLLGGFTAGIHDNQVTIPAPVCWLKVDGSYNNITAINNGTAGGFIGRACFAQSHYFYNASGLRQVLAHYGNGQYGDYGWPFNTRQQQEQLLLPPVRAAWTPSLGGLLGSGFGLKEIPDNNSFTIPTTGSDNFLDFMGDGSPITGTFDVSILANQTSGTGQVTCQITDRGTPVGAPVSQNITATSRWHTLTTGQAAATNAGVRCWNSGKGTATNPVIISQINLVDH